MSLKSIVSTISRSIDRMAASDNLVLLIVDRKYVLINLSLEKLRSQDATLTSIVKKIVEFSNVIVKLKFGLNGRSSNGPPCDSSCESSEVSTEYFKRLRPISRSSTSGILLGLIRISESSRIWH